MTSGSHRRAPADVATGRGSPGFVGRPGNSAGAQRRPSRPHHLRVTRACFLTPSRRCARKPSSWSPEPVRPNRAAPFHRTCLLTPMTANWVIQPEVRQRAYRAPESACVRLCCAAGAEDDDGHRRGLPTGAGTGTDGFMASPQQADQAKARAMAKAAAATSNAPEPAFWRTTRCRQQAGAPMTSRAYRYRQGIRIARLEREGRIFVGGSHDCITALPFRAAFRLFVPAPPAPAG